MRFEFKVLILLCIGALVFFTYEIMNKSDNTTIVITRQYKQNDNCNDEGLAKLKFGMSTDEVKSIWGNPMNSNSSMKINEKLKEVLEYCCYIGNCGYKLYFEDNEFVGWEK